MRIDRVELIAEMARQDLSVIGLAERTGLSRNTITGIRCGKSCSKNTAEKISAVLGTKILERGDPAALDKPEGSAERR